MPRLILPLEPLDPVAQTGDEVDVPRLQRTVEVPGQLHDEIVVPDAALEPWVAATLASVEGCLVVDTDGLVVAVSDQAGELLGFGDEPVVGRRLLEVIEVVDLDTGASEPEYAVRIPPLATLAGSGLARSMLRIRHYDDTLVSIDATSSPVHAATGEVAGSMTFLRELRAG